MAVQMFDVVANSLGILVLDLHGHFASTESIVSSTEDLLINLGSYDT